MTHVKRVQLVQIQVQNMDSSWTCVCGRKKGYNRVLFRLRLCQAIGLLRTEKNRRRRRRRRHRVVGWDRCFTP